MVSVLLSMFLLLSGVYLVDSTKYSQGADFGNQSLSAVMFDRMKNANGYEVAFLEAFGPENDGSFSPFFCKNVKNSMGYVNVEAFMIPNKVTAAGDQITALTNGITSCGNVVLGSIWIKIVKESSWDPNADNVGFLKGIIAEARAARIPNVGIHVSKEYSDQIMGPKVDYVTDLHANGIWYASPQNTQPNMGDFQNGFGGFTKANAKQYKKDVELTFNQGKKTGLDIFIPTGQAQTVDVNGRLIIGSSIMAFVSLTEAPTTESPTTRVKETTVAASTMESTVTETDHPTTVAETSTAGVGSTVTDQTSDASGTAEPTPTVASQTTVEASTAEPTTTAPGQSSPGSSTTDSASTEPGQSTVELSTTQPESTVAGQTSAGLSTPLPESTLISVSSTIVTDHSTGSLISTSTEPQNFT